MLPEPFDDLYQKHFREIHRHCYRVVRNKQDAEELANESFVKAYFNRKQFDKQKGKFRTWIFTIATRLCLDFLNSNPYRRQQQTNSINELFSHESYFPLPDQHSEHQQLMNFFENCLSKLTADERTAFTLRYLQGFKLQEIARILNLQSPNSAKNRIKSGKKKMKECLEKKGIDDQYWKSA